MSILFLSGINDRSDIRVTLDQTGNVVRHLDGNCPVQRGLSLRDGLATSFLIFGKGVMQSSIAFKKPPTLIFNQIGNPDTHRGALERCIELCDPLDVAVINHPQNVLESGRDKVSQLLRDIPGILMPRTLRCRPRTPEEVLEFALTEGIGFPFIVRLAGLHDVKGMVRVDSDADVDALHAFPFDGRAFYLTEYVDYRDEDGFYHRQRIAVIDGEPLLLTSVYGPDWNVPSDNRAYMLERESWQDDQARIAELESGALPEISASIGEIAQRLKLECFGIDCSLLQDGRMLVFEASAHMNILHNPHPQVRDRFERLRERIYGLLSKYSGENVG